jgi:hypothetical protein
MSWGVWKWKVKGMWKPGYCVDEREYHKAS